MSTAHDNRFYREATPKPDHFDDASKMVARIAELERDLAEAKKIADNANAGRMNLARKLGKMTTACRYQVENIERWLKTGEPAGPEESKAIYEQLKAALRAVGE